MSFGPLWVSRFHTIGGKTAAAEAASVGLGALAINGLIGVANMAMQLTTRLVVMVDR